MLKFYNTLSGKKEKFIPVKKNKVGMYSCGPTVYDVAHVGNLSSFVFVDLLKRWLKYRGYKVTHIMNLTDVEDKIIRNSSKTLKGLKEYTEKYIKLFFQDLDRLNVEPADIYPKATEHIKEMAKLTQTLLKKGYAYHKDNSVYFRISTFPGYGKFSNLDLKNIKTGARVDSDEYAKESARDFVLWKGWKKKEDGEIFWETEVGKGRPGWHIECSAMSMKYLGETIDIHTGGVDLIFPHHQNEIAQSEAATGKKFVKYWLHREFLNIDGSKMSKSAGTGLSLTDVAPDPLDIDAFRYLIVTSHYRSPLNLTQKSIASARNTLVKVRNLYQRLEEVSTLGKNKITKDIKTARAEFIKAMDDDLGSPKAMAAFFKFIAILEKKIKNGSLTKSSANEARLFIEEIDTVLGVLIDKKTDRALNEEELDLIAKREEARKNKDWGKSDDLRNILLKKGVQIEDTAKGTRYYFI